MALYIAPGRCALTVKLDATQYVLADAEALNNSDIVSSEIYKELDR